MPTLNILSTNGQVPDPDLEKLRYPIGQFEKRPFSETQKMKWISDIQSLPALMELAVQSLDAPALHTPYRPGGWTIHQLVHHVADSHMNAYIRLKMALTEHRPVIKSYEEHLWAELEDTKALPVNISLTLLHSLHLRWAKIYESLKETDWDKVMIYPQDQKEVDLWEHLGLYSWHGRHHLAHIMELKDRMGWS
ncbi:DinB superfamily protein [Arachidicoccus rhizosphaerae]|uniref:DinB superfamily protein n=2 Tax=Arachidicoccus rhizosphaerae TaxID=551991 RepID=A0A1H3YK51_9BACT|nr:DinB superfamily protein [Arachidicoccus rhizosphaerae]